MTKLPSATWISLAADRAFHLGYEDYLNSRSIRTRAQLWKTLLVQVKADPGDRYYSKLFIRKMRQVYGAGYDIAKQHTQLVAEKRAEVGS